MMRLPAEHMVEPVGGSDVPIEDQIRMAGDAEEIRIRARPLTGEFSPFIYDTEIIYRSKKLG